MGVERRNDIGMKVAIPIFIFTVTFILGIFFNHVYNMAQKALDMSVINERNLAVVKQCYEDIDRRLDDMDRKLDKLLGSRTSL